MPKNENGGTDGRKGTGRELYLCDPGVNVACGKRSCGHLGRGGCFATDHGAFAKRDESGKPGSAYLETCVRDDLSGR